MCLFIVQYVYSMPVFLFLGFCVCVNFCFVFVVVIIWLGFFVLWIFLSSIPSRGQRSGEQLKYTVPMRTLTLNWFGHSFIPGWRPVFPLFSQKNFAWFQPPIFSLTALSIQPCAYLHVHKVYVCELGGGSVFVHLCIHVLLLCMCLSNLRMNVCVLVIS